MYVILDPMTTATFIGLALAYTLAFLRLARVIQPSYRYFPAWAQIALTVAVASAGVLSDSLGNDVSRLDLIESLLLAGSAGLAAWKGRAAAPLLVLLFCLTSTTACSLFSAPPPETAARDAYKAAKTACQVYELAPAEYHTDEQDRVCRSLRLVCE